jgi:hypothetical protein
MRKGKKVKLREWQEEGKEKGATVGKRIIAEKESSRNQGEEKQQEPAEGKQQEPGEGKQQEPGERKQQEPGEGNQEEPGEGKQQEPGEGKEVERALKSWTVEEGIEIRRLIEEVRERKGSWNRN